MSAWAGDTKEEEVDLDALEAAEGPRPAAATAAAVVVPEHDYDRRLLAFPALLVLILAWNVKWKPAAPPRKAQP